MPKSKQLSQQLFNLPFVYSRQVMPTTAQTQLPLAVSHHQEPISNQSYGSLPLLGVELVFTQDAAGRYLSFFWQQGSALGLNPDQIVGELSEDVTFSPAERGSYLERLQRILTSLVPEKCHCWFSLDKQLLELELVISPILPSLGNAATAVLVMGRVLQVSERKAELSVSPVIAGSEILWQRLEQHKRLVSQITNNIWRTLDLDVIWQQTVDNLGEILHLSRCIICPYHPEDATVEVIAEYHQPHLKSILGTKIEIADVPDFVKALATRELVVVEKPQHPLFQRQKAVVMATCYQDKPNALICAALPEAYLPLTAEDLELVREVSEQIGTAIAHATLYKELAAAREQAEEASRKKSEFLASMSHELRTPLNGMIGFIKLILDGMVDEPEEQTSFLQEAHKSSIHLLNIINDILDIAKIEAGKMEWDLGSVQLHQLFEDVEKFMRPQAERKNLSFRTQMPQTCDEILVYGNYQRLKQVMLNLVGNAIKFTHEGGVTISADVVRKKVLFQNQEYPGQVKVRVQDSGIGVSLDKQDKLFELFSQVDGSRTRQYGGTGLGLTISQKLVEAMGGTVDFYSLGEGLGSTVTFTIPLYQQPVMLAPGNSDDEHSKI